MYYKGHFERRVRLFKQLPSKLLCQRSDSSRLLCSVCADGAVCVGECGCGSPYEASRGLVEFITDLKFKF